MDCFRAELIGKMSGYLLAMQPPCRDPTRAMLCSSDAKRMLCSDAGIAKAAKVHALKQLPPCGALMFWPICFLSLRSTLFASHQSSTSSPHRPGVMTSSMPSSSASAWSHIAASKPERPSCATSRWLSMSRSIVLCLSGPLNFNRPSRHWASGFRGASG